MNQPDQPVLAWFISGALYFLAFAGASLGAVLVALESRRVEYIFPTFTVILIVGLLGGAWFGNQISVDEEYDKDEGNANKTLWIGAGAVVAFFVTGGIVAGYVTN